MQAISQQLVLLEGIAARLRVISARTDPERKKDLVVARRDLMDQLSQIEQIVKTQPSDDISSPVGDFGKRLASLRTSTARFQAEWPAVTIDDDSSRYAREAGAIGQLLRDFIAWGHKAFGQP